MSMREHECALHSRLRINLMGELTICLDGVFVRSPRRLRTQQLFALLLLSQVAIPRTAAAAQLWPDLSAATAIGTFRRHLSDLHSYLTTALHNSVFISRTQQGLQLVIACDNCIDTTAILTLSDRVQSQYATFQEVSTGELNRVLAMASRPLLETWSDVWLQSPRLRLEMARQTLSGALSLAASRECDHYGISPIPATPSGCDLHRNIAETDSRSNLESRQHTSSSYLWHVTPIVFPVNPHSNVSSASSLPCLDTIGAHAVSQTRDPSMALATSSLSVKKTSCTHAAIPLHLDSYVNRARELEMLHKHLRDSPLVVVSGEMGIGKSRFAAECVRIIANQSDESTFWLTADCCTLTGRPDGSSLAALRTFLHNSTSSYETSCRQYGCGFPIIVFDGFDAVLSELRDAILEATRACPQVRIIATLRSGLSLSDVPHLTLTPLSTTSTMDCSANSGGSSQLHDASSDVESLFLARVFELGKQRVTLDERRMLTTTIYPMSEGNPLVIEALAARTSIMSIRELMDIVRLALPSHHTNSYSTIRAWNWHNSIEREWSQLASESRSCMERLWIFRHQFGNEHILSVWHWKDDDFRSSAPIHSVMEPLIEYGWMISETCNVTGVQFRIPILIREFAQFRSRSIECNPPLRQSHARFVLTRIVMLVNQKPELDEGVLESIFDAECDDLAAAITAFNILTSDDLRIAVLAAVESWRFWINRGMLVHEIEWVEYLVSKASDLGDEELYALASDVAAMMRYAQGDVESAARHGRNAVLADLSDISSRQHVVARIHLAGILAMSGDLAPARELAREAVCKLSPQDEIVHMIDILGLAADIFLRAGDLRSADEILGHAHGLAGRVVGMPRGAGRVRLRLGTIAIERGEYQLACELLQGADRQVVPLAHKREHGRIKAELALAMRWMGNTDEAARILSDVIRRSTETGDRLLHLICLCNLADIWCDSMMWESASLTLQRARCISGDVFTPDLELDLCNLDLIVAIETGDLPRQSELTVRVLSSVEHVGDIVSAAWAYRTISGAYALAGDLSRARHYATESVLRLYPYGNLGSLVRSLEATAHAVATSIPSVAGSILGACAYERGRMGAPRTPRETRDFDSSMAAMRQVMAHDEAEASLHSGSSLGIGGVSELVLSLRAS